MLLQCNMDLFAFPLLTWRYGRHGIVGRGKGVCVQTGVVTLVPTDIHYSTTFFAAT